MKLTGCISIVVGIIALIAALLPLSQINDYQIYVSIEHLGTLLKILYILPIGVVVIGLLAFTGKLSNSTPWLVVIGILGLLLAGFGSFAAINHLEAMGSLFGERQSGTPSLAVGAYASLLAYAAVVAAPFLHSRAHSK